VTLQPKNATYYWVKMDATSGNSIAETLVEILTIVIAWACAILKIRYAINSLRITIKSGHQRFLLDLVSLLFTWVIVL
jgi:hypothetical protein